eukprot:PhM_4_TR4228/c0_g1_i1/m.39118
MHSDFAVVPTQPNEVDLIDNDARRQKPVARGGATVVECFPRGWVSRRDLASKVGQVCYTDVQFERVTPSVLEEVYETLNPDDTVLVLRSRGTLAQSGRVQLEEGKVEAFVEEESLKTHLQTAPRDAIGDVARQSMLRDVNRATPTAMRQLVGGSNSLLLKK